MIYEDIQIKEICEKVDLLTKSKYRSSQLPPIYGAGQLHRPRIAFVFINPTHRNISSAEIWRGLRAPWIGVKNIWRMMFESGVISKTSFEKTQTEKDWTEEMALEHYRELASNGFYVTNLVKWTGKNAKLPDSAMVAHYREILKEELNILKPRFTVAFGQLTFNAMIPQERGNRLGELTGKNEPLTYNSEEFKSVVPSYFPVGQGIKNWKKAVQTVKRVVSKVARN